MALPNGWIETELGELLDSIVGGGTPTKTRPDYFIGEIPFVTVKDFTSSRPLDTIDHISKEALIDSASQLIPKETILITTRMSIAKVAIFNREVSINQDVKALFINPNIDKLYIEKALNLFAPKLIDQGTGTTVKGIRLENIKELSIPLPPLNEQRRIVAKLEAILAKVQSAQAHLKSIPELLKRTRQAILSSVFSKFDERKTASLGELTSFVTSGSRGWAQYYSDEGSVFIRVGNVQRGSLDLDLTDVQHVQPPEGSEGIRTKLQEHDLVITITADLGRVGYISGEFSSAFVNQHVALVRLKNPKQSRFIGWYLSSIDGQSQLLEKNRGMTKSGLGLDDIREVRIPILKDAEIVETVNKIERLLVSLDNIEETYIIAKAKIDAITQSALSKAFRGELVPQDANDEPASILLERIKTERATQAKAPKTKRTPKKGETYTEELSDSIALIDEAIDMKDIVEVLKKIGKPISPEMLFKEADYSLETVETFYAALKNAVDAKKIEEKRSSPDKVLLSVK